MHDNLNYTVSVIVPVYNVERYLTGCIHSILEQKFTDIELILVNDDSTDNSLEICRSYEQRDVRVKVFDKDNGGQGSARNLGLLKASGEFIMFIDADDSIDLNTICDNICLFENYPDLDFIQYPIFMKYGTAEQSITKRKLGVFNQDDDFIKLALGENTISWIVCDKIFRRSSLKDLKFREDIKYEDNYFMMQLLPRLKQVNISDKGIYYYYHREGSTTTSKHSLLKEKSTVEVLLLQIQLLSLPKHKKLFYKYLSRYVNVERSLLKNYNIKNKNRDFHNHINIIELLFSDIGLKNVIKIFLYKFAFLK